MHNYGHVHEHNRGASVPSCYSAAPYTSVCSDIPQSKHFVSLSKKKRVHFTLKNESNRPIKQQPPHVGRSDLRRPSPISLLLLESTTSTSRKKFGLLLPAFLDDFSALFQLFMQWRTEQKRKRVSFPPFSSNLSDASCPCCVRTQIYLSLSPVTPQPPTLLLPSS